MTSSSVERGVLTGSEPPAMLTASPGPQSLDWLRRFAAVSAPMGPRSTGVAGTVVYREAAGANVIDVDGNRYVDLAGGFGSLLIGHRPAEVEEALVAQSARLCQSLGDVHPSDMKVRLLERLTVHAPAHGWQAILGQSGADAVSAALKTALLHTGKPGVVAFAGAYHGLSYGPLSLCGLRASYRTPFAAQLNPAVRFVEYPANDAALGDTLGAIAEELGKGDVGALVFEPILGRGGVIVPPATFAAELGEICRRHSTLLIADEIWTGLGRGGHWLFSVAAGACPDIVCLGKGLGGVLPISACLGRPEVMACWSRAEEVVHTSTFAGAPLACATALATLDALERQSLVERSRRLGSEFSRALTAVLPRQAGAPCAEVRGAGLMLGIDVGSAPGSAVELQRRLLGRGYIVSLGGGRRESIVLTPPLDIAEELLEGFVATFGAVLREVLG